MNFLQSRLYVITSIAVVILYILPLVILGENSYIYIHDVLDSHPSWAKTLAESGQIFAPSNNLIDSFMNTPRGSLGDEFNIILWLFYFFDPYTAYVLNQILIRIVAFIGMYLLMDKYIFKSTQKSYSASLAMLYALLPFYAFGGLSVAGLPLITYVFLNIRNNSATKKDWLILVSFPFYSSFVFTMMFFIIVTGFVWIYDIIKKTISWRFTLALILFGLIYLILNYRLLEVFIFGTDWISHRTDWTKEHYGFLSAMKQSIIHFIMGQYHAHSLHLLFAPFVGVVFLINLFANNKNKLLIGLVILNIVISLWYGFWGYEGWETLREKYSILTALNLSRFHFLTPLIWYVLFGLSIKYLVDNYSFKYRNILIYFFIAITTLYLFYKSDFIHEYRNSGITYKQFFAQSLFKDINSYIDKDKSSFKVASIGIHPSIARYNGYYTLDGYMVSYPLEYKKKFRNIISPELKKDESLSKYFDDWGSRCYIFSSDVGGNFLRKKDEVYPINIDLNTTAFYEMEGRYIFSSYEILNANKNYMKLLKVFTDDKSAWDIYLYEIIPPDKR